MVVLLADVNIEGHVARLTALMQADHWREFWDHLQICSLSFREVGLLPTDSDAVIWQLCQREKYCLLTNNRNDDGPDSLESTIRAHNDADSLPIFTISDADRILQSREYAERVTESLFDYLLRLDTIHGTGRLFLP